MAFSLSRAITSSCALQSRKKVVNLVINWFSKGLIFLGRPVRVSCLKLGIHEGLQGSLQVFPLFTAKWSSDDICKDRVVGPLVGTLVITE